jgi:hypothetical protein
MASDFSHVAILPLASGSDATGGETGGEDNRCAVKRPNAATPRVTNAPITPTTALIALSNPVTALLAMRFHGNMRFRVKIDVGRGPRDPSLQEAVSTTAPAHEAAESV